MIEAGEQDKFVKSLTHASQRLPNQIEPLEMMADFSRHTSDPFHLTGAHLMQLVELETGAGNMPAASRNCYRSWWNEIKATSASRRALSEVQAGSMGESASLDELRSFPAFGGSER